MGDVRDAASGAAFPWGVMVIDDESTSDLAPSWGSPEDLVTQALGIMVMRVRHAQEGSVVIHLCRGAGDLAGEPTYGGVIDVRRQSTSASR